MTNTVETFYVASQAVNGAGFVFITSIDLYFKTKPSALNNTSGINYPGVNFYLCEVENGIPNTQTPILESLVRKEYNEITAISDASIATNIAFPTPIAINTEKYYGIVIVPDDSDYQLWYSKQGDKLVGTNTPSPGPSGRFNGEYYNYYNSSPLSLPDRDLKMIVNIAKFIANTASVELINGPYEILSVNAFANCYYRGGELVFQDFGNVSSNVTFYCNGTLNVSSSNVIITGTSSNLSVFGSNDYIVITDGTNSNTDVVKVAFVTNATHLVLERTPIFSNTVAKFKKTVVGKVYNWNLLKNRLVLEESTANSTMYFTNSSILTANIVAGGSGYSNLDRVVISGGGSNINAVASITTNSSGGIVSLNFSNTGNGFNGSSVTVAVQNTTGGSPNGSSASITVNNSIQIGSYLKGVVSFSTSKTMNVENYPIHAFDAEILTAIPSVGIINAEHVFSNTTYYVNTSFFDTTSISDINYIDDYNAVLCSRSNEVLNPTNLFNANTSAVINVSMSVNQSNVDLFQSPYLYDEKMDVIVLNNNINNDANNEWKPYGGNAISKHITTKISFGNNVFAEDLLVYLDAWKPSNTSIKVYAKLWKDTDNDPFDDKYWTPLEQMDPNTSVYSSSSDSNNIIEYTYGLPQHPEVINTLAGFVTTTISSSNIIGSNTAFNTDLATGYLVKIYDPKFSNTNFIVTTVNSVVNSTLFTIDAAISNSGIVGDGFKVDVLNYTYTAWKNNQNSNVARYYNSSLAKFDGFNHFQLKVVFLSSSNNISPYIKNLRAIGVSA